MSETRRDFLRTVGLIGLGGAVADHNAVPASASEGIHISDEWMGVLVDIPKCVGCRKCEFACKEGAQKAAEHRNSPKEGALFKPEPLESYDSKLVFAERLFDLDPGMQVDLDHPDGVVTEGVLREFSRHGIALAKDGKITIMDTGPDKKTSVEWQIVSGTQVVAVRQEQDHLTAYFYPKRLRRPEPHCHTKISRFDNPQEPAKPVYVKYNCLHCNKPACASACLVGAFRKLPEGPVIYDAWKCMGCRYCMVACPFGIPTYEYDNPLTPQVRKCTLCADEGNPYKGKVPACIKICPAEVMTYGKRSALLQLADEKIREKPDLYADHVYGAHEVGGTSWMYLAPKHLSFKGLGFLELGTDVPPLRTEVIQHGVFKYFIPPLAWYGLLGAAMWVSKPRPQEAAHGAEPPHHLAARRDPKHGEPGIDLGLPKPIGGGA